MDGRQRFMVFNIGCIECGVSSGIVGFYTTEDEARAVSDVLNDKYSWREGGQNHYEVYDLSAIPSSEYADAIAKATGA